MFEYLGTGLDPYPKKNFIDPPKKMVLVTLCSSRNCCFVVPFTCLKGAEITQVAEVRGHFFFIGFFFFVQFISDFLNDTSGSPRLGFGSVGVSNKWSEVKWSHVCFIGELILVNQFRQEVPEDFGASRPQNIPPPSPISAGSFRHVGLCGSDHWRLLLLPGSVMLS